MAPATCSTIGNTCSDGSKFAGFMVYGSNCQALFVTASVDHASRAWSSETIDTGADNATDGRANQQWIAANTTLANYPAFQTCENLTRHSKTDWYLPARQELYLLYANRDVLNFANNVHLSSTQAPDSADPTSYAWGQLLTSGYQSGLSLKSSQQAVRCVRRD